VPRRSSSSSRWLQRQAGDPYVKQSRQQGYRSRAAYKLKDINQRDRLLKTGTRVLDLGASPGGWTQVACELVGPRGTVVALDVLKMPPIVGAIFIEGDCRDPNTHAALDAALGGEPVDIVLSDMAPNMSGIALKDGAALEDLVHMCLELAERHLRPGGALVVKLFEFAGTDDLIREIKRKFATVVRRKPAASRSESREFYVVAKGFGI
jgi:23S rRNA (uridine2552-2'-O)-methyltransferase